MKTAIWKSIFRSVPGTSHIAGDIPCQDSSSSELFEGADGRVLIAVAADGAGSASCADTGSALVCSFITQEVRVWLEGGREVADIDSKLVRTWVQNLQLQIASHAESSKLRPRDFASTLLAAIVGNDAAVFLQIGDGAIVVADCDESQSYNWVFWPQQGQYANETNFVTDDDALDKIEFNQIKGSIDEVALFTDGIQGLTLHYETRQVHTPFFEPVFQWLRMAPEHDLIKYTAALESFLNSEKINDRTEDDKTLILATRKTAANDTAGPQSVQDEKKQPAAV